MKTEIIKAITSKGSTEAIMIQTGNGQEALSPLLFIMEQIIH